MARYRPCVLGRIQRIVRDAAAAEDLTQEVFLRVWTRAKQWSGHGTVKAWVLRIATNLALNHLRSMRTRRWQSLQPAIDPAGDEVEATPGWMLDLAAQNPAKLAELAEQHELVGRLLAELPEDRRQMLAMVFEADLRMSDVADRLGIPTGTAKSRLHYTVKKLADAWQPAAPGTGGMIMAIQTQAPWHKASFDAMLNDTLPALLAQRVPLAGYLCKPSSRYTCHMRILLSTKHGELAVDLPDVPQSNDDGVFEIDGKQYVVLPVASREQTRSGGDSLCRRTGLRLHRTASWRCTC